MTKVKVTSLWFEQTVTKVSGWAFLCRYLSAKLSLSQLDVSSVSSISDQLDELINETSQVLKDGDSTSVVQLNLPSQAWVIKRYNARNFQHHFSRAVRSSRAQRCWSMSFKFMSAGLNVAPPVMMYEERFGPLRMGAYFINEKLSGEELLTVFPLMNSTQKKQVVDQVYDVFAKMRNAKITHGDMKATNILWVDEQLYFIDLDAAQEHYFNFSFTRKRAKDKKRFLKNWKDQPELLALFERLV